MMRGRLHDLEVVKVEGQVRTYSFKIPIYFVYGKNKGIMFHSEKWCKKIESAEHCTYKALDCYHWLQVDKADEFNKSLLEWLEVTHS